MIKKGTTSIQRGQAITFRLPSDTPDHLIKKLQKLKETERRNFSSKIAEILLEGVNNSLSKERETVTIPLPRQLSKEQRNWLKHAHSEAMLGSVVYQLLMDPVRATTVLASLNSNAIDINEALYLQERETIDSGDEYKADNDVSTVDHEWKDNRGVPSTIDIEDEVEGDLMNFNLEKAREELAFSVEDTPEETEEDAKGLLSDFLTQMNK
jgi:hypothetical protein